MGSHSDSSKAGLYHSVPAVPPQKRSPRACDQCRERKTKCDASSDGRCESCVKASLPCSFVRRPNAPDGIRTHVSHLDPRVYGLQRPSHPSPAPRDSSQSPLAASKPDFSKWTSDIPFDATISTMGDRSDRLSQTSAPRKHYSLLSGLGVLRRLHELSHQSSPYVAVPGTEYLDMATVLDQNVPSFVLFGSEASHLPPKNNLLQWIDCALLNCPWLDHITTRAGLDRDVERLYSAQDFGKVADDRDRLALIYAVLALGQRYQNAYGPSSTGADPPFSRGLQAFSAAHEIVNPIQFDRSLSALASGAAMSLYLASYSAQTTAHIYSSNVAAAALRLGLHEDIPTRIIPESERQTRRRLFSAIVVMDAYASVALGLPSTLRAPGHRPGAEQDTISSIPTAYLGLLSILSEAMEQAARAKLDPQTGSRLMSIPSLQGTGSQLDAWFSHESTFSSNEQLRSPFQQRGTLLLLKYTAAYVQMLIYSPFLHHITTAATDHSFYATTSAIRCLDAAVWAIELAGLLEVNNCFDEAYPLTSQTLVFATTILLNVQLCSSNATARQKSAWGCPKAVALLDRLATRSCIAGGCLACLRPLYEPLNMSIPTISTRNTSSSFSSADPTTTIPNNTATTDGIASLLGQYPSSMELSIGFAAAGQPHPIPRSTSTLSDPNSAMLIDAERGRSATYDFGAYGDNYTTE